MNALHYKIGKIISETAVTCIENGIDFILSGKDAVFYAGDDPPVACAGYFCGNDVEGIKILATATGKPMEEWLPILLHESSHMDQYLEKSDAWMNITLPDGREATDELFAWFAGKEIENPADIAARALNVELDCERRTLAKILKYGLQDVIDPVEYVKKANSYVYFYLHCLKSRSFYKRGNAPYMNDKVWTVAPDNFDGDYTKIPEALAAAFDEHM